MKFIKNLFIFFIIAANILSAQTEDKDEKKEKDKLNSGTVSALKWRSIGPAWTSGRIADFAVNPNNLAEYYVATASGGLWKTTNSGTTWIPLSDTIKAYAMGVVTLDPNNPHVVWLGTGENNHQRALGYGTGVYRSSDGGFTWNNMGLKDSRQIGGIVIDSRNSNIIFVAAEGSVWGPGGDRGLYKSTDGGTTWTKKLNISENTGVNNVVMDPKNPDILYATSEQRRRHIFTKISGGPETAVYRSTDNGETWNKIMKGLPSVDLGGMGIAISPVNTDVIYLSVEAAEKQGGFYRSTNRGASWTKMSDTYASGQYFNEIYTDPQNVDKVYLMDVVSKFTIDGGKTWKNLGISNRHVDDHAFWINPKNTNHYLVGGDGGVYESFDGGENWNYKSNFPITQFYRVNVDNSYPFYFVYGGTQDNNSMGGPSRTTSSDGIVNSDWYPTVGGDGFFQAIDPTDPNIVYSAWQYGNIVRYDKKSGEVLDIRPEPGKGEKTFKWYWDTPFFISPHSNTRLYIAAERVFRSDNRGESWTQISGDLTTKTDRNNFKVMDKYWSIDAVSKDVSTSLFGLIVSLAESPLKENLLFAGTDDGIIQISEDAKTWRRSDDFPDVPDFTLVSDILPSRFDENVVYATFNNHKRDDFKPYVLKSTDKGKSWKSIAGDLPENGAVNTIVEDTENPNLLFVGTEWSVYFTIDGGKKWIKLGSGLPNIKVTDMVIQEREKDLVIATFGRGFYLIDDYSPLRELSKELLEKDAHIFKVKDASMFIQSSGRYGQGADYFKAPNPDFGAVISYYVKDVPKTYKSQRKEKEKELFKKGEPIPQPTYAELESEKNEVAPYFIFYIKDDAGNVVRKINKSASSGMNRVVWNLRYEMKTPVNLKENKFNPTENAGNGMLAMPGKYAVSMSLVHRGVEEMLVENVSFSAKVIENTTLPAGNREEMVSFQRNALELARVVMSAEQFANELSKRIAMISQAFSNTSNIPAELLNKSIALTARLNGILFKFNGQEARASAEEIPPQDVPLNWRLNHMIYTQWSSTSNVTKVQKDAYSILSEEIKPVIDELKQIGEVEIKNLELDLEKYKAPWTPGRIPELK